MLLSFFLLVPASLLAGTTNDEDVGTIDHYNGILFRDLIGEQADIEGALALAGDAVFGGDYHGYDIGASTGTYPFMGVYQNPNNYPSFLLGGTVSESSGDTRVEQGDIVMKISYKNSYEQGGFSFQHGTVRYVEDTIA